MTTIHLDAAVADALLKARGWSICEQRNRQGTYVSFTRPGRPSRVEGGQFGTDYLWERDEALTEALTNDVRAIVEAEQAHAKAV